MSGSLDPRYKSAHVQLSKKNMTALNPQPSIHSYVVGDTPFKKGKHAFMVHLDVMSGPNTWVMIG